MKKKWFNFYTNIVGTIPLRLTPSENVVSNHGSVICQLIGVTVSSVGDDDILIEDLVHQPAKVAHKCIMQQNSKYVAKRLKDNSCFGC